MEMTNCGSRSVWQIEKANGRGVCEDRRTAVELISAAKVERADSGPMRRSR
jgi:hypothetical protein